MSSSKFIQFISRNKVSIAALVLSVGVSADISKDIIESKRLEKIIREGNLSDTYINNNQSVINGFRNIIGKRREKVLRGVTTLDGDRNDQTQLLQAILEKGYLGNICDVLSQQDIEMVMDIMEGLSLSHQKEINQRLDDFFATIPVFEQAPGNYGLVNEYTKMIVFLLSVTTPSNLDKFPLERMVSLVSSEKIPYSCRRHMLLELSIYINTMTKIYNDASPSVHKEIEDAQIRLLKSGLMSCLEYYIDAKVNGEADFKETCHILAKNAQNHPSNTELLSPLEKGLIDKYASPSVLDNQFKPYHLLPPIVSTTFIYTLLKSRSLPVTIQSTIGVGLIFPAICVGEYYLSDYIANVYQKEDVEDPLAIYTLSFLKTFSLYFPFYYTARLINRNTKHMFGSTILSTIAAGVYFFKDVNMNPPYYIYKSTPCVENCGKKEILQKNLKPNVELIDFDE